MIESNVRVGEEEVKENMYGKVAFHPKVRESRGGNVDNVDSRDFITALGTRLLGCSQLRAVTSTGGWQSPMSRMPMPWWPTCLKLPRPERCDDILPGAQGWESSVSRTASSMIGGCFAAQHRKAAANAGCY